MIKRNLIDTSDSDLIAAVDDHPNADAALRRINADANLRRARDENADDDRGAMMDLERPDRFEMV